MNKGILGSVATTGFIFLDNNVSKNKLFDPDFDKLLSFQSKRLFYFIKRKKKETN